MDIKLIRLFKIKKEISYKDAVLNLYDVPVFISQIFHPDPTVERRSGLLAKTK